MKKLRRVLSILLVIVMCVSLCPSSLYAEEQAALASTEAASDKKTEEKTEEKKEDKKENSSEKKSEEKSSVKTEEKSEDKSSVKTEEKSEEKSAAKTEEKSEDKSAEKTEEKSEEKSSEKTEEKSKESSEDTFSVKEDTQSASVYAAEDADESSAITEDETVTPLEVELEEDQEDFTLDLKVSNDNESSQKMRLYLWDYDDAFFDGSEYEDIKKSADEKLNFKDISDNDKKVTASLKNGGSIELDQKFEKDEDGNITARYLVIDVPKKTDYAITLEMLDDFSSDKKVDDEKLRTVFAPTSDEDSDSLLADPVYLQQTDKITESENSSEAADKEEASSDTSSKTKVDLGSGIGSSTQSSKKMLGATNTPKELSADFTKATSNTMKLSGGSYSANSGKSNALKVGYVLTFTPKFTHSYTFESKYTINTSNKVYLYIFDNWYNGISSSSVNTIAKDESGSGKVTYTLQAGTTYYIGSGIVATRSSSSMNAISVSVSGPVLTLDQSSCIAATCQTDGKNVYRCSCSSCNNAVAYEETVEHGDSYHVYPDDTWTRTQDPTCVKTGVDSNKCSLCQNPTTRTVAALGHDYKATETENACVTRTTYTCQRSFCTEDTTGHSYSVSVLKNGADHDFDPETGVCKNCGSKGTKVIIKAYSPYNDDVDYTGLDLSVYYATGTNTYSDSSVGTVVETGDNKYYTWVDPELAENHMFKVVSAATAEIGSLSGTVKTDNVQEDGNIYCWICLTNTSSFGPVYFEANVYDAITGELVSGNVSMNLQYRQLINLNTGEYQWITDSDYNFYAKSGVSGKYIYAAYSGATDPAATGGPVGRKYQIQLTSVPEGYTMQYDTSKSKYQYILEDYSSDPDFSYGNYIAGAVNDIRLSIYLYPEVSIDSVSVKNAKTKEAISGLDWELYTDADCTKALCDDDGNALTGKTDAEGNITVSDQFNYDWENNGETVYVKLSSIGDEYTEAASTVKEITLAGGAKATTDTIYLTPYASDIPLIATVIDSTITGSNKTVSGRTVEVYEYNSETKEYGSEPIGTLTDNGDGTYSGIKLTETAKNQGEFRIKDKESGAVATVDISGQYDKATGQIDIASYDSLLSIMKKDESGNYIGEIDLTTKDGQVLDSTDADTKAEKITEAVDGTTEVLVDLYDIAVDEDKVEDDKIYQYELPENLVPGLNSSDKTVAGSDWIYLNKSGKVNAYGRIVEKEDKYVLEVYFTHTAQQVQISFGVTYIASIADPYKSEGGTLPTEYFEKELSFDVNAPVESKLDIEKKVVWVNSDDRTDSSNSSTSGADTKYDEMQVTLEFTNKSGKPITANLKEEFSDDILLTYNEEEGISGGCFEVYVDNGDGYESIIRNFQRCAQIGIKYNDNLIIECKNQTIMGYGEPYSYATKGFDLTLNKMPFEKLKIVFYTEPYYGTVNEDYSSRKNSSGSVGSSSEDYTYSSTVDYVTIGDTALAAGTDYPEDDELEAVATKKYTSSDAEISMEQYNTCTGVSVNSGTYDSVDQAGRIEYQYGSESRPLNSGGESWYSFEEIPYGREYSREDSFPEYSSRNYFFRAKDFSGSSSTLSNSFKVYLKTGSGSGYTDILSASSRIDFNNMYYYDYVSYTEMSTLFSETVKYSDSGVYDSSKRYSASDIDSFKYLTTYRYYDSSTGRNYWIVVSPETWECANYSSNRYDCLTANGSQGSYGTNNLPGGIHIYILGLKGDESFYFSYKKYQQTLTTTNGNLTNNKGIYLNNHDDSSCTAQYVGSTVYSRNRSYQAFTKVSEKDTGDENLLTKKGTLLPDGSIKYEISLDVTKLKAYYYNQLSPSYAFLYESLPEGYTVNTQGYYDKDFNISNDGSSYAYQSYVLYIKNKNSNTYDENVGLSSNVEVKSWILQNSVYPSLVNTDFLGDNRNSGIWGITDKNSVKQDVSLYASIAPSKLVDEQYAKVGSDGHYYVDFMYIAKPGSNSQLTDLDKVNSLYSASEFLIMGKNSSGDNTCNLLDSAAGCYVSVAAITGKTLTADEGQSNSAWTSTITVDACDEDLIVPEKSDGSYSNNAVFSSGSISIFDHMRNTKVYQYDDKGNKQEISVPDIAKYIKLKDLSYTIQTENDGDISGKIDVDGSDKNIIASSAGADASAYTLYAIDNNQERAKYGFNRYTSKDTSGDVKVYLDYAPEKSSSSASYTLSQNRSGNTIAYGGEYYGMNGGFELYFESLPDTKAITIDYQMEFDYEEFAADHPEYGMVTIEAVNTASRDYGSLNTDTGSLDSDKYSWSFAVKPDLTKSAGNSVENKYGYTFNAQATVGATGQKSIYLLDQIVKVTDYGSQTNKTTPAVKSSAALSKAADKATYYSADKSDEENYNPDAIKAWTDILELKDLKIAVNNYLDSSASTLIYEDGEVAEGWKIETVDKSAIADVQVPDGVTDLDTNVFAFKISKADGSALDSETYFTASYELDIVDVENKRQDVDGEKLTPFRNLEYYSGGQVDLQNQMTICYQSTQDINDISDSGKEIAAASDDAAGNADGTVTTKWVAAGATATGTYLEMPTVRKSGTSLHETDEDKKIKTDGTSTFEWYLTKSDKTAGKAEFNSTDFGDTIMVTALLDSKSAEEEYAGLGDDSLNAAWTNLFFKYLTVNKWTVTATDTEQGTSIDLSYDSSLSTDKKLVYKASKANEDGSYLTVTINLDSLYKSGDSTWNIAEVSDDFTNADKSVYNPWGVSNYANEGYMTKAETLAKKEAEELPAAAQDYGYNISHLFDVSVENEEYLTDITVNYSSYINWSDLFADADSLCITDEFKQYADANRDALGEDFMEVIDAAVEKQEALDKLSEEFGKDYKIGLYDLPRYSIFNEGVFDTDTRVYSDTSWSFGDEVKGTLAKTVKVDKDGNATWSVDLGVDKGDVLSFTLDDRLTVSESAKGDVLANSELALDYIDITGFKIIDKNDDDKVLYEYTGDFTGKADIPAVDKVYDAGSVSFEASSDDKYHLFTIKFDRVLEGNNIAVVYTTDMDYEQFAANGGDLSKDILVNNAAAAISQSGSFNAAKDATIPKQNDNTVTKAASEYGLSNENEWNITAGTGSVGAAYLSLADDATPSSTDAADYISIEKMKVLLLDSEKNETVIYDSEEGINKLSDYDAAFDENYKEGQDGVYDFTLTFGKETKAEGEAAKIVLPKDTTVKITYVTALNNAAYKEKFGAGSVVLTNKVTDTQNGMTVKTASDKDTLSVHDELSKVGSTPIKNSDGSFYTTWTVNAYLDEEYSTEELAKLDEITITDTMASSDQMTYVKDSITLLDLTKAGQISGPISKDDYTVKVSGQKIIVTLKNPSNHPRVRMVLKTLSPAAVQSLKNTVALSVNNKKKVIQSPEVTYSSSKKGYVKSLTRSGTVTLTKTDKDTGLGIEDVTFKLYALDCDETDSGHTHTLADCYKAQECLIADDFTKGVYHYDSDYAEEDGKDSWEEELLTGEEGILTVDNLPYGEYILREEKTVDGYILPDEKDRTFSFTINRDSFTDDSPTLVSFDYDLANEVRKFNLKKTYKGTVNGVEKTGIVSGAEFSLYEGSDPASDAKAILVETTDAEGSAVFDYLDAGDYTLRETSVPEGYKKVDDMLVSIAEDGSVSVDGTALTDDSITVSAEDELALGKIMISKTGEVIKDSGLVETIKEQVKHAFDWITGNLEDVSFEIYAKEDITLPDGTVVYAKDTLIDTITTNDLGVATLEGLLPGEYYAKEKETGDQYKLNTAPIALSLVLDGEEVKTAEGSLFNSRKVLNVKIVKTDADSKEALADAVFGLYSAEDQSIFKADELIGAVTTDAEGKASFTEEVPLGSYYVKEIEAPEGYELSDEKYEVTFAKDTVDESGTQTFTVNAENVKKGSLVVTKTIEGDVTAAQAESAVAFTITGPDYEDGKVFTLKDDFTKNEDGTYTLELNEVTKGQYTVVESSKDIEGKDVTVTYSINADGSAEGDTAALEVSSTETTTVDFNDTYADQKGNLEITKTLKGDVTAAEAEAALVFTVTGPSYPVGKTFTLKSDFTKQADGSYTLTLQDLLVGEYTVKETGKDMSGRTVLVTYSVNAGDSANGDSAKASVKKDETAALAFVDTYTYNDQTVKIIKWDTEKKKQLKGASLQIVNSTTGKVVDSWVSNGKAHVTKGLKVGVTYTIKETKAPTHYQKTANISFTVDENGKVTLTNNGRKKNNVIYVDNEYTTAYETYLKNKTTSTTKSTSTTATSTTTTAAKTGDNNMPVFYLMLCLGSLAVCGYLLRRKRKED